MIKKIKRLSTMFIKFIDTIEILRLKFLKLVKYAKRFSIGVGVYLAVFATLLVIDNNTKKEASVLDVFTSVNFENSNIDFENLLNDSDTEIVEEKIAEDTHVIFSMEESVMYNIIDASIKVGPEIEKYDTYKEISQGTEIKVLGYNKYNVAKILFDEQELYIDANLLTHNKDYIFENVDGVVYAKKNTYAYVTLEPECEKIDITSGQTIKLIGTNNSSYSKIEINGNTYFIYTNDISDSSSYIFEQENKTMYARGNVEIKETQDDVAAVLTTIKSGNEITVIGTNNSSFYKVKANGFEGYVSKNRLTDSKSNLYPFLTLSAKSPMKYNEANAKGGQVATVDPSQQTEENVYLLAQLIFCEAGGQGYEAQRAVATVVINRAFDGTMGNTIYSVIHRPRQFSPVGSGKIYGIVPRQENLEAARDVLINGYRSFPAYVLYFQSIRDGYFRGHSTYCTAYNNDWTHPQYFSYKYSDYLKYK